MAQNVHVNRENRLFNATHLNMIIDLKNPPAAPSTSFLTTRLQAKATWEAFEAAGDRLVSFDDDVHTEIFNHIPSHHNTKDIHLQDQRARFTAQLHETRIAEV
jgi:hypothetical protein